MVAGRLVPYTVPAPDPVEGQNWPITVDAAPRAMNAKLHPVRTGAVAALSIDLTASISDLPVTVDVIEGDADSVPILTVTMTTTTRTLDATSNPTELGNRALPDGKDSLAWRVRMTDVAGDVAWFGPASANRDPLPNGVPAWQNYRAAPIGTFPFDPDTDQIRYTSSLGKVRTFHNAELVSSGSPVTYQPGDAFDDLSTESALVVDEIRTGAIVEYQGGGEWVVMWTGDLHGEPSIGPSATMRVVKNTGSGTEDLYITPNTAVSEDLFVYYRDGDTTSAPLYQLRAGSLFADGPRSVTAGTEVGAGDYWYTSGSPSHKLAAIPLTRDQVRRITIGVEGKDSGVQTWLPYQLSLLEQPWLESTSGEFDIATHALLLRIKGGAHCASVFGEASDASNFSAPLTDSHALADGDDVVLTFVLSAAQLGKTWYLRATPFSAVSLGGLTGVSQVAQVSVPRPYTLDPAATEDTNASTGTLTLTVADPASVIDTTNRIKFYVTVNGVRTLTTATSAPGGSATTGTFVKTITLDAKHNVKVEPIVYFADGSNGTIGAWMFDSDKLANVLSAVPVVDNTNVTVNCVFDTDTVVGSGKGRYRINGGSFTTFTVASGLTGSFTIALTSAAQTIDIEGMDSDGNWGPPLTIQVEPYQAATGLGTVSVDSDGSWSFTADGPANALSFRYSTSTSSFPASWSA